MLGLRLGWGILLVILILLPRTSGAIESGGLSAYPTGQAGSPTPWFQYYLAPGQTTHGSVTIDNRTSKTQDLLLYPVDAAPNGDGGFGMAPSYLRPNDAGQWIKLDSSRIRVTPGTAQQVGFRFDVPVHVAVGPHYAGIAVQPSQPPAAASNGLGLHIITRLGVRLYETVPGIQRPHLSITALRHRIIASRLSFPITLHNGGNTILTPVGRFNVTNELGLPVASSKFNLGSEIKPNQTTATIAASTLRTTWLPRHYHATLILTYGGTPTFTTRRSIAFWIGYPSMWLIALLLATIGGFLTLRRSKLGVFHWRFFKR